MDDKAPGAFRTISEVADELDLPQHVLRFWESRFNDIKPMKRGGGRRYYRPDDIDLLRGIRHLLYGEGYTIRGVQRILREQGVDFVQAIWRDGAQAAPAAGNDDEEAVAEETLEADDAEEFEETDDTEDEEADEPRGIRGRLTSLIGRDLNDRSSALADREDPPMDDPPMPRIDAGDRIGSTGRAAAAPSATAPLPRPAPAASGMSTEQRERLRQVLDELKECRKRIDAASPPTT